VAGHGRSRSVGSVAQRLPGPSGEAVQLVIDYAKQETVGPIRGLGRFVGFGVAGSIALSIGTVLLLIGLLRLLQTETGSTFTGNLSWIPYLIVAAVALIVMALAGWRITQGPARRTARYDKEGG